MPTGYPVSKSFRIVPFAHEEKPWRAFSQNEEKMHYIVLPLYWNHFIAVLSLDYYYLDIYI